jgi:hypothetical protein
VAGVCERVGRERQWLAKAAGKHCGRPFIDTKLEGRIRAALAAPDRPGLHKIAKQFGVGTGTVQRIAAVAPPGGLLAIARLPLGLVHLSRVGRAVRAPLSHGGAFSSYRDERILAASSPRRRQRIREAA